MAEQPWTIELVQRTVEGPGFTIKDQDGTVRVSLAFRNEEAAEAARQALSEAVAIWVHPGA